MTNFKLLLIFFFIASTYQSFANDLMAFADDLKTDYRVTPMGIDRLPPKFHGE